MKDMPPPRFVPILTEVVSPANPPPSSETLAVVTEEDLARRVVARVLLELEPLVLEALHTIQAQQAHALEALVRTELASRVARIVDDESGSRPTVP